MEESRLETRRGFLKKSGYASVGFIGLKAFAVSDLPKDETRSIVIAHTNDMHSHIDPFPEDDPKYPGLGGMAERATLIDKLRSQHGNILLLDAGDIFQGTPYFNHFGGHLELELMSKMGYDAATMGNHDFDNGMNGFVDAQKKANFPFLCSNYDFSNTLLNGKTKPHHVFKRNGLRIGVFGLGVELDGLVDKRLCEGVIYNDPIKEAERMSSFLRNEKKCNMVICLSHLGYEYDRKKVCDLDLGASVSGIDLIVGGHTHTFLDKPTLIRKSERKTTYINQVGWAGVRLGVLQFTLAKDSQIEGNSMTSRTISGLT